jgi:hypothetical protein
MNAEDIGGPLSGKSKSIATIIPADPKKCSGPCPPHPPKPCPPEPCPPSGEPLTCIQKLISDYMYCGERLTSDQEQRAFRAFSEVTQWQPINLEEVFSQMRQQSDDIFMLNAYYFFIPLLILIIIVIWVFVITYRISWILALFLSILAILTLYLFSIAYRNAADSSYNTHYNKLENMARDAQQSYERSVAYWVQGLLASSCAVTNCTDKPSWTCNKKSKKCK